MLPASSAGFYAFQRLYLLSKYAHPFAHQIIVKYGIIVFLRDGLPCRNRGWQQRAGP